MGQKANPISLRLNINRNFDSCWFQDKSSEYSKLLQQDLNIREYIRSLFQSVGVHAGRIGIQIFPKKLIIHYFFHDTEKKSRKSSSKKNKLNFLNKTIESVKGDFLSKKLPKVAFGPNVHYFAEPTDWILGHIDYQLNSMAKPSTSNLNESAQVPENSSSLSTYSTAQSEFIKSHGISANNLKKEFKKRFFIRFLLTRYYSLQNKNLFQLQNFLKDSSAFVFESEKYKGIEIRRENSSFVNRENRLSQKTLTSHSVIPSDFLENYELKRRNLLSDTHLKHIESNIEKSIQSNTLILPVKIHSRYKSAQFICEYVCQRLQQNIPFRQIYKQLLLEMKKYDEIQGMRITCSGRIGGVEMARVESRKYGQTSLHVFSSKIDFATHQAYTLFGLIGVKVWVCFHDH
jgi:ribosomal protein S3